MKKYIFLFSLLIPFYCNAQSDVRSSFTPDDADFFWAVNLLKTTFEQKQDNFVVSPLSLYSATALLINGAEGNTEKELLDMMTYNSQSNVEDINTSLNSYITGKKDSIKIVNKISGSDFKPDYVEKMKNDLFAEFSAKVSGKKLDILKKADPTLLVLENIVDFKDEWETHFDEAFRDKFYSLDGKVDAVNMMKMEEIKVAYYKDDQMQAIRLPYKNGNVMHIFLPNNDINFTDFIKKLTAGDLYLEYQKILADIYIPKFEIEYENEEMVKFYENNGVKTVFILGADLNKMCYLPHHVDKIIHKAKIKTDEQGTEAHAYTGIIMPTFSASMFSYETTIKFIADHPFIFMINNGDFIGVYAKGSYVK